MRERGCQNLVRRCCGGLMTETTTGTKRIKGLLPNGTVVAHKTGTSATVKGVTAATNDVGLVTLPNGRHLAIAVFVSDSTAGNTIREEAMQRTRYAERYPLGRKEDAGRDMRSGIL